MRKERERLTRKEMRKAVPSLTILLARLKEKNLLPAIFFIFSRAGCDQAAETICNSFKGPRDPNFDLGLQDKFQKANENKNRFNKKRHRQEKRKTKIIDKKENGVLKDNRGRSFRLSSNNIDDNAYNSVLDANRKSLGNEFLVSGSPLSSENWKLYSSFGLLNYNEVKDVAGYIAQFNNENPEIAFPDDVIEQLLFGLGRHHAGMLPAHKMLVENLFRMNLVRAVFATETLSAGINMPARTTVICSLAKRGGSGSMALLETSNLLQMAGRAGRRGMDTIGTCVLVATPFEGEDVAANLLIDPIKPISSQFCPSYSLAVNLIARGNGRLDVAKQLVSRSFANWGRHRIEETQNGSSIISELSEVLDQVAEEKFINSLIHVFDVMIRRKSVDVDVSFLTHLREILKNRQLLKETSKNFDSAKLTFELEQTTLGFLTQESKDFCGDEASLVDEDEIFRQVEEQQVRVRQAEKNLKRHPFSSIANFANEFLKCESSDGKEEFSEAFKNIQETYQCSILDAEDIARFAKSTVVVKRRVKKLMASNPGVDPEMLLYLETQKLQEDPEDPAWKDMLAITKVLVAFGCITPTSNLKKDYSSEELEDEVFEVTPAGIDVGMLSFENSLWSFLAMGGTFDTTNASAKFDEIKEAMETIYYDKEDDEMLPDNSEFIDESSGMEVPSKAQHEAESLLYNLRELSPGEMAGYVSCLVSGDSGRNRRVDSMTVFKRLAPRLQRSIQILLDVTERFTDIQRQYLVNEKLSDCQFDLSYCEVVTAWANGCTWNEALEISGVAPGDLTRIIGRATDAVRQVGALQFNPIRKNDLDPADAGRIDPLSRGIHPEVRHLCREAAKVMNRYPVKDTLSFDVEVDEIFSENPEDGESEDVANDETD